MERHRAGTHPPARRAPQREEWETESMTPAPKKRDRSKAERPLFHTDDGRRLTAGAGDARAVPLVELARTPPCEASALEPAPQR